MKLRYENEPEPGGGGRVTIMIASRDRRQDLAATLRRLRLQNYACRLCVIDDGSTPPLEDVVLREWPDAAVQRFEQSAGQSDRRSCAFRIIESEYILQLDDDSSPVDPDAVRRAVDLLDRSPHLGALAFHIFNGPALPTVAATSATGRYGTAFVGCGALLRTSAARQTAGYRAFFRGEWEEQELGLQLMKKGWALYYAPNLVIHHRLSGVNRDSARTWMRGVRNKLWSLVMHFPLRRLPFEFAWTLFNGCWDAIRLLRFVLLFRALGEFAGGLPRAMRLREPMDKLTLARYDALRFREIRTEQEWLHPPACGFASLFAWFQTQWLHRARQRSFWDRRAGDVGKSTSVSFAHEFPKIRRDHEG
jgi:GT2 family glycosyltransferase